MSFAQPFMLFGLAALAVPLVIHLIFRRRPRRQAFPAIELLLKSARRVESSWRLRRWLLLATRMALLALFVFAASRPFWAVEAADAAQTEGPRRIALVIDSSLSMRATYGSRTAFERALELAEQTIGRMGPEDLATIVEASDEPRVRSGELTGNPGRLRRTLQDMEAGITSADLGRAVTLAARALRPSEEPSGEASPARIIYLFSDLARGSVRTAADPAGARVQWVPVVPKEAPRDNRAILSVQAEPMPSEAPRTFEFRVRVRSHGDEEGEPEQSVDLSLRQNDRTLEESFVQLAPGGLAERTLTHVFPDAGNAAIHAELEPDRLMEDNRRYAVARVRPLVRLLVVDGAPSGIPNQDEVFYLEKALRTGADDQPPPVVLTVDELAGVDYGDYDVVWLAGVPQLSSQQGQRLAEFVKAGGGLAVSVAAGLSVESYSGPLAAALPRALRSFRSSTPDGQSLRFADPDFDHPLLALFRGPAASGLMTTRIQGHWIPEAEDQGQTLLSFETGEPALMVREYGRGRSLLLLTSIDRDLADFAIRPAFVPWVRQSLLWLGRSLFDGPAAPIRVGELRTFDAEHPVQVRAPDGRVSALRPGQGYRPLLPGVHRIEVDRGDGFVPWPEADFAVQVDLRESDLRPMAEAELRALLTPTAAEGAGGALSLGAGLGSSPQDWVHALLLAMLGAFLLEGLLSLRRARP